MDRLQSMRVFQQVVDEGGFAAAARKMDLAPAVVRRQISDLEQHLGVRLFQHTTRRLSLTQAGERYLERLRGILLLRHRCLRPHRAFATHGARPGHRPAVGVNGSASLRVVRHPSAAVTFHCADVAHASGVGVLPEFAAGPALPQEIPALVELFAEVFEPGRLILGGQVPAEQFVLFAHQLSDVVENVVVIHDAPLGI